MTPRHNSAPSDFIELRKRFALYQTAGNSKSNKRLSRKLARPVALAVLVTLVTASFFYSGSSASSSHQNSHASPPSSSSKASLALPAKTRTSDAALAQQTAYGSKAAALFPALMLQATTTAIETFSDSGHNTESHDFVLGNTVYVKESVPGGILARRRVAFVDPAGFVRQVTDVTLPLQEDQFVIPSTATTTIGGSTLNNIGTWRASIISSRGVLILAVAFKVGDPDNAIADLSVSTTVSQANSQVPAGFDGTFDISVANSGPSDAQAVELSNVIPANTAFVSMTQTSGPTFTCAAPEGGVVKCTIANFTKRSLASFIFTYTVNAGTPAGSLITDTASVASTAIADDPATTDKDESHAATAELNNIDNSSTANAAVTAAGGTTCSLECPENINVNANTTQDGTPGRFVSFGTGSHTGDCGSITASPASGSFFPVGTTTVTVTSGLGGGSCSFTVTVIGDSPISISCPANKTVTAPDGSCEATVDPGTPTTTPSGLPVEGIRGDGKELTDPYPVGTTTITWTATDANENVATCTQTITVNSNTVDTAPPTITAPDDITVYTGADGAVGCAAIVGETELGLAEAHDDGCFVNVARTGVPTGNLFPVGTTTVTYTATDGAGHTASDTQTVTVIDNTPPVIRAPADAAYACPSEVPTANPSQATGAPSETDPNAPLGPPTDNCGTPVVTVFDSHTGAGSAANPLIITRTYTAKDAAGNTASASQTITVTDSTAPTIAVAGASSVTVECHTGFTDPGVTTSDNCDNPVIVTTDGTVDPNTVGTYTLSYTAQDWAGNTSATVTRTVIVQDTIPPDLTLNGANPMTVECHMGFADPGATASDGCAGDLTSAIVTTGVVNPNVVGSYTLTYSVSDGHNTTTKTRVVNVVDTTAPTITLTGAVVTLWPPNHSYRTVNLTTLVASADDLCDDDIDINDVVIEKVTSDETENGNGDGNTLNDIVIASNCKSVQLRAERNGSGNGRVYTITFLVRDASGNTTRATATVTVPKSQNGATAVDDGPHYTVNSNCH